MSDVNRVGMIVAGMSRKSVIVLFIEDEEILKVYGPHTDKVDLKGWGHLNLGGGGCGPSVDRHQSRSAFPGVLPYSPRHRCSGGPTPSISNE
jgi:hypothetical protein